MYTPSNCHLLQNLLSHKSLLNHGLLLTLYSYITLDVYRAQVIHLQVLVYLFKLAAQSHMCEFFRRQASILPTLVINLLLLSWALIMNLGTHHQVHLTVS